MAYKCSFAGSFSTQYNKGLTILQSLHSIRGQKVIKDRIILCSDVTKGCDIS